MSDNLPKLIPLEDLVDFRRHLPDDLDAPILVVCNTGRTSLSGALVLSSMGYTHVRSLLGGTSAWKERGYPLAIGSSG